MGLHIVDWIVISGYFLVLVGVVWWSSRKQDTSEDYFLAGRNVGWFAIGASLFASNIGSEHLVGLAGAGAKSGIAMAHYELHAWCLLILGWVFVPFFYKSGVFTMPEFLERRYNSTSRWILSLVSLVAYIFTKVSVTVFAGGLVFKTLMPDFFLFGLDSFWFGALSIVIITGIYTVLGGLRAVIYTDALQCMILIFGSLCLSIIGLVKLGGWDELRAECGSTMFNLWRPANDPDFPWPGMLFAAPITGLWYWCTDQYIVQRTLAAKNLKVARRGTIFGAYLKITPIFIFIIPGMIAYALAQKGLLRLDSPDQAFPSLVYQLMPIGLKGLLIGALLSALMSSLSSLFNSCSTLFTVDVYQKINPKASEKELVTVGRIATGAIVILGILWIPVMKFVAGGIYEYLQSVQAYLAPPITAVFFLGVFWKRLNGKGAAMCLGLGFSLGMVKLGCQIYSGILSPEEISKLSGILNLVVDFGTINFLLYCVYMFLFSSLVLIVVSLLTTAPSREQIEGVTYATVNAQGRQEVRASWNTWDVIHTIIIIGIILTVYVYFSG